MRCVCSAHSRLGSSLYSRGDEGPVRREQAPGQPSSYLKCPLPGLRPPSAPHTQTSRQNLIAPRPASHPTLSSLSSPVLVSLPEG